MKRILSITITISIFFLITACKKENKETIESVNAGEVVQCFNETSHDSTSVANALIGNWNEQSVSCMINSVVIYTVTLKFNADGTYKKTSNTVTTEGKWTVDLVDQTYFQNPPNSYEIKLLRPNGYSDYAGIVSFCGTNMSITPIGSDGCYIVYERIQ